MKKINKKIVVIIVSVCTFILSVCCLLLSNVNQSQGVNIASVSTQTSAFRQTKSVSDNYGERLDSGKEYSSLECIIFSNVSASSSHAKDGITLKTDFVLGEGEKVSWSILASNAGSERSPASMGEGYLLLTVDADTNKANIKCLKPFNCIFYLSAKYGDEVKTFNICYSSVITECNFMVMCAELGEFKVFSALNDTKFEFGSYFLNEKTFIGRYGVEFSTRGYWDDNGIYLSAKLVVNDSAVARLSKFMVDRYGLSLVSLEGDYYNLVDCLKVKNADNSLSNITDYPELINEIKTYSNKYNDVVCSIDILLDCQTQVYENTLPVFFNK